MFSSSQNSNFANALAKKDLVYIGNANSAYPKTFDGKYREILVISTPYPNAHTKVFFSTAIPIYAMGAISEASMISTNMLFRELFTENGNYIQIQVIKNNNSTFTLSISSDLTTPCCAIFGRE